MKNETYQHIVAHSSLPEYEGDGDIFDKWYLPGRAAVEVANFLKKGRSAVGIMPDHQAIRNNVQMLNEKLLQGEMPVIYTSGNNYLLDKDIYEELLPELKNVTGPDSVLHPYKSSASFRKWAEPLITERGVEIYSDPIDGNNRWDWTHKGAYHRWLDDVNTPSPLENIFNGGYNPIPQGYVVQSKDEMHHALDLLVNGKQNEGVAKPIFGAGGFQIDFIASHQQIDSYVWPINPLNDEPMPIAFQQKLKITRDEIGREKLYSLQFCGEKPFGRLTRQIMNGNRGMEWSGNIVPSGVSREFEEEALHIANKLLQFVKPKADGGIDIADVDGRPMVIEVNGGRPTGAHTPKRTHETFAPKSEYGIYQKVTPDNTTALDAWGKIESAKMPRSKETIVFQADRQTGVFPSAWFEGMWGMLISVGHSYDQANIQMQQARDKLGV